MNRSTFYIITLLYLSFYSYSRAVEFNLEQHNTSENTYPALTFDLNQYVPKYHLRWRKWSLRSPYITACPASTDQEMKFNRELSMTGNSVFLKNIFRPKDNATLEFCNTSVKPETVYNVEHDRFEIGYELYYETNKITWDIQSYRDISELKEDEMAIIERGRVKLERSNHHQYRLVNENNEIINQTKSKNHEDFQQHDKARLLFINGSQTLAFHWVPELLIEVKGYNKHINLMKNFQANEVQTKCDNFSSDCAKMKLYISLEDNGHKNTISNGQLPGKNLQEWTENSYGNITISTIIPPWYFPTYSGKLACCTPLNMLPVWKTIAEGQLKKVDLYLQAVIHQLTKENYNIRQLTFGVCGALTSPKSTNNTSGTIYLSHRTRNQTIPVPKIIYRVIEAEFHEEYELGSTTYNALVVIHNDPAGGVSDEDRVCTREERVLGWQDIENEDPTTGVTYVCQYALEKIISTKLRVCIGCEKGSRSPMVRPLNLNRLRTHRESVSAEMAFRFKSEEVVGKIRNEYEKLLSSEKSSNL